LQKAYLLNFDFFCKTYFQKYCTNKKTKEVMDTPSPVKDNRHKDKEILNAIVKEMTTSSSGAQSTKHWAKDVLWFDIPPFASRGVQPAVKMFDNVFSNFKSANTTILEIETVISGSMGIVCSIQKVDVVFKNDVSKSLMVRQTDCFKKTDQEEWLLIHQHASVPLGGEWDGKIISD
jgi:ketosteroid isomerase-like protein